MTAHRLVVQPVVREALSEEDWAHVRAIRERVFIREQGCAPAEEWDAFDAPEARGTSVHHLLATVDGRAVGVARWRSVTGAAKLERFAVLPEARGLGVARALVACALDDACAAGHRRFVLHAQTYVAGLYAGFGFKPEGPPFDEAGLEHVKMALTDR